MHYVDGFVLAIPKRKLGAYRRLASRAGKVWMEHGALEYRECVGEDLAIPGVTSFLRQMKAKPNETIIFAWIVFKSRSHRDRVNAKVMKDPRMRGGPDPEPMPFEMKRMLYGGFETIVDLE